MMKKKGIVTAVACVLVAATAITFVGATSGKDAASEDVQVTKTIYVDTATPVRGDLSVTSEYIGKIEPGEQVMVYPKAQGEVLTANFNVGDTVQAGDVLAELDSKTLQLTIAQTQAAIASAEKKASYNLAMAEKNQATQEFNVEKGYDASLVAAEAGVLKAENAVQTATAALTTARRLQRDHRDIDEYDYEAVTGADYDKASAQYRDAVVQAELGVESAQLALQQAQESLRSTKKMAEEQQITINDSVKMAELNTDFTDQYLAIEQLQENLKNYVIRASISGVIEQRNVDPFDIVTGQSPVYVISNKDIMTVSFNVSEYVVTSLDIGETVTIEKNGQTCTGSITEIGIMTDTASGLFPVKISVENAPFPMLSGSTVKVFADTQKAVNDLIIPIDAVYYESGQPYVYILEGGIAKKTLVETGISSEGKIQILTGLTTDSQLITTWHSGLKDGAEVVLTGTEPPVDESSLAEDAAPAADPSEGEE